MINLPLVSLLIDRPRAAFGSFLSLSVSIAVDNDDESFDIDFYYL